MEKEEEKQKNKENKENEKNKLKNKNFIDACRHAIDGLIYAITTQSNIQKQLVIAIGVIILSLFYPLKTTEFLCLIFAVVFVIFAEMINTAIETVVDLYVDVYHPKAKIAKDVGAGAVLLMAINSVIVAYFLFLKETELTNFGESVFNNMVSSPIHLAFSGIMITLILVILVKSYVRDRKAKKSTNKLTEKNTNIQGNKCEDVKLEENELEIENIEFVTQKTEKSNSVNIENIEEQKEGLKLANVDEQKEGLKLANVDEQKEGLKLANVEEQKEGLKLANVEEQKEGTKLANVDESNECIKLENRNEEDTKDLKPSKFEPSGQSAIAGAIITAIGFNTNNILIFILSLVLALLVLENRIADRKKSIASVIFGTFMGILIVLLIYGLNIFRI